jgi:hypothetical protein
MRCLGMRAAMVAGLVGCGGGTEPDRSFRLTVSAPERAAVARNSPSASYRFSCEFTITARAAGGGAGDYAGWDGASIDVSDGATFRPQVSWAAAEVAAFFRAERISAGGGQSGTARVDSNAEQFGVTYAFRYRLASGAVETASVTTACG